MDYRYIPFYVQGNTLTGMYYGGWQTSDDRDIEYVKEMYPATFDKIQELVEKECNRQEYIGSMIFDEYPDKMGILRMVNLIFDGIKKDESECMEGDNCIKYPDDNWLKDIIMVLLLNEMYRRRQKRKKYY